MFFDEVSLKDFIEALRGVGLTCSLSFYEIMTKVTERNTMGYYDTYGLHDFKVEFTNKSSQGFWLLFTNIYITEIQFLVEVAYAPEQ